MKNGTLIPLLTAALLLGAHPLAWAQAQAQASADSGGTNSVAAAKAPARRNVIEYVDADLRDVVRAMSRQAGMNVLVGEDVSGRVTTRLVDIPIEQALKIILESKGYVMSYDNGVYQVRSKASLANEPTETRIITLKNTSTAVIAPIVTQLMSRQGKVQLDGRSNSIILTDTPSSLKTMVPILEALDTPTPQVMIEFRLLETSKNPLLNTGIKWSGLTDGTYKVNIKDYDLSKILAGGPTAFAAGATILTTPELTATLNFLVKNTDSELLANPRVVTTDNTPATIKIVDQEPIPNFQFNSTTASFVLSGFDYKDIGATLKATPHVNRDEFITLDLQPEFSNSAVSRTFSLGAGGGGSVDIPVISTRNVQSQVVIKSGHTLALGGLMQKNGSYAYSKLPILGDIPLIGYAFRSSDKNKTKRNLLFFITPTIIPSGGKTGLEDQIAQLKGNRLDDFVDGQSWLGNAKGYQIIDFGQVVKSRPEEYDFERNLPMRISGPDEPLAPTTTSARNAERDAAKEKALMEALEENAEPVQVTPHLAPSVR
ncbi:MAG: hypothetical protein JO317_06545 [Verrucomicrobiae bacterium]|nr:hypothetical protein [Verrucomicrobiae bacterium]